VRSLRQSTFAGDPPFTGVTLGVVVDTNDPQQMGRVRALCLGLNDASDPIITDIPWAAYSAPFAGTVQAGTRGSDNSSVTGPVAYGAWAIPKIGSQVLIMCLDGNPQTRVWIGCLHVQLATHTMPHGRFLYQDDTALPGAEKPDGPVSTIEDEIEPLYTKLRQAFGNAHTGDRNFEFQTRGADFQVSGVGLGQGETTFSTVEDDQDVPTPGLVIAGTNADGTPFTGSRQGYQTSRFAPTQYTETTPRNLDNTVTAVVTPGFHAVSMDDRAENCRIRVRTTGGHQIIMDDTNERIYLSTANGKNWIEMDEKGNIDIFTTGKISAHAQEDINFTSEKSIRMYGKAGIQLKSDQEVRVTADNDISLKTGAVFRVKSEDDSLLESSKDIHLKASIDIFNTAAATIHTKGKTLAFQSTGNSSFSSGGYFTASAGGDASLIGSKVNLNSGGSVETVNEAEQADSNNTFNAFFPNRIPDHEPWARVDTKADDTIDPAYTYTHANVGKESRVTAADGTGSETSPITRGSNWRR